MKFQKTNSKSKWFTEAFAIYEESFPEDERRDFESQVRIFENERYSFYAVFENKILIGIITEWRLGNCSLIEHLAIKSHLRNQGLGTRLVREFLDDRKGIFIVEAEMPETEIAKRRLNFYKRLSWKLNSHNYIQPSYSKEKNPLQMKILSFPKELDEIEFTKIRNTIHSEVYGFKKPIISI